MVGRGDVAASDHDRWRAIEMLKWHGRPGGSLTTEAYTERVGRVYAARTHRDLDQVFADLPPVPSGAVAAVRDATWPLASRAVKWAAIAAIVGAPLLIVAALLVTFLVVRSGDDDSDTAAPALEPARVATTTTDGDATAATEAPASTASTTTAIATTTPPPDPLDQSEVLLVVGQDIEPGRHIATDLTFNCYWERVSGLDGTFDQVIVNGLGTGVDGQGHLIVDIAATDAGFRSSGCGEWRPYVPPALPATTMGDGDWLVGSDIEPGLYSSTGPPGQLPCSWERASDFTHEMLDDLIDFGFPEGVDTVQLQEGERFTSDGCGTWSVV